MRRERKRRPRGEFRQSRLELQIGALNSIRYRRGLGPFLRRRREPAALIMPYGRARIFPEPDGY